MGKNSRKRGCFTKPKKKHIKMLPVLPLDGISRELNLFEINFTLITFGMVLG